VKDVEIQFKDGKTEQVSGVSDVKRVNDFVILHLPGYDYYLSNKEIRWIKVKTKSQG
jgi:hypothetical protein